MVTRAPYRKRVVGRLRTGVLDSREPALGQTTQILELSEQTSRDLARCYTGQLWSSNPGLILRFRNRRILEPRTSKSVYILSPCISRVKYWKRLYTTEENLTASSFVTMQLRKNLLTRRRVFHHDWCRQLVVVPTVDSSRTAEHNTG